MMSKEKDFQLINQLTSMALTLYSGLRLLRENLNEDWLPDERLHI